MGSPPQTDRGGTEASDVDPNILARSPLGDQLLVAHQLVAADLVGLLTVLVPQGIELLAQGIEDRVVLVHGTVADEVTRNVNRNQSQLGGLARAPWAGAVSGRRGVPTRLAPAGGPGGDISEAAAGTAAPLRREPGATSAPRGGGTPGRVARWQRPIRALGMTLYVCRLSWRAAIGSARCRCGRGSGAGGERSSRCRPRPGQALPADALVCSVGSQRPCRSTRHGHDAIPGLA